MPVAIGELKLSLSQKERGDAKPAKAQTADVEKRQLGNHLTVLALGFHSCRFFALAVGTFALQYLRITHF